MKSVEQRILDDICDALGVPRMEYVHDRRSDGLPMPDLRPVLDKLAEEKETK